MSLRDYRTHAKYWSAGRAELSERGAAYLWAARRTRRMKRRVRAAERDRRHNEQERTR